MECGRSLGDHLGDLARALLRVESALDDEDNNAAREAIAETREAVAAAEDHLSEDGQPNPEPEANEPEPAAPARVNRGRRRT